MDAVRIVRFGRIERLPATGREDVLVALVPGAHQHLTGVRLVLLHARVGHHANVVVHVEVEQRARLAARLTRSTAEVRSHG